MRPRSIRLLISELSLLFIFWWLVVRLAQPGKGGLREAATGVLLMGFSLVEEGRSGDTKQPRSVEGQGVRSEAAICFANRLRASSR
jgi:hypothetical protein